MRNPRVEISIGPRNHQECLSYETRVEQEDEEDTSEWRGGGSHCVSNATTSLPPASCSFLRL